MKVLLIFILIFIDINLLLTKIATTLLMVMVLLHIHIIYEKNLYVQQKCAKFERFDFLSMLEHFERPDTVRIEI